MKLGILSESHGSISRTNAAIKLLTANQVDAVIHCGDIGSEDVLVTLSVSCQTHNIPIYAVLGNVDYPDNIYAHWHEKEKFEILGRFGDITLAGKRIAIVHGDRNTDLQRATLSGVYDYVFTGHTHVFADNAVGETRIINPGAIYRSSQPSLVTLDLGSEALKQLYL